MRTIKFERDGYEIVVDVLNPDSGESILEADAYYKDFDNYKILLLASNEDLLIQLATTELLNNHPFEKIIQNYDIK